MTTQHASSFLFAVVTILWSSSATTALAADPAAQNDRTIKLADGALQLTAPESWTSKEPSVRIIDYEFAVPASKGDDSPGRMTVMGAGGSVEDNIDRWIGQFSQPDGGNTKDRSHIKKTTIAGEDVTFVDISGTFKDQRGPFAPAVNREKFRMLGAIIASKKHGNYFLKLTGPQQTIADQEKAFRTMVEGLRHD